MAYRKGDPICKDERPCFARRYSRCSLLMETYAPERCPFCKEFRDVSGGDVYEYKPHLFGARKRVRL